MGRRRRLRKYLGRQLRGFVRLVLRIGMRGLGILDAGVPGVYNSCCNHVELNEDEAGCKRLMPPSSTTTEYA